LARYFAHSLSGKDEKNWQELKDHLVSVADSARSSADKFGAGAMGEVAGLLHDVGKYSAEFQRKLHGAATRVDHSTAGARIVHERYPPLGRLLAYVIAGHHAGLANGTGDGDLAPLATRLDAKKYSRVPACAAWEEELALPGQLAWTQPAPHPDTDIARGRRGHCLALLTRMLLSALVDADRLDTEAFYAKAEGKGDPARGGWQPLWISRKTAAG